MLASPAVRPRGPKLGGLGFRILPARRWGQRGDGRRLVVQSDMGVDAQGEPDIAVPGKGLGHLGRDARPLQAGDEQVAVGMEVGEQPVVILVF